MRHGGKAFAGLTLLAMTLAGAPAEAAPEDRELCASTALDAQASRDEGKYRRAREQLLVCARDVCPAPIKRDCLDWLSQLENIAPTVVFTAKDGAKDVVDAKVYVDGALVTEHLDGKPIPMDLGQHVFKFDYNGQIKEETVVIGAGQKGRNIGFTFGSSAPAGGSTSSGNPERGEGGSERGSIVPAIVVGSIGVVALGSWAIFGLGGTSDVDTLQKCRPRCAEEDVDSARTKLIIADISLGVGLVALGVATYMFLTRPQIDTRVQTGQASLLDRVRLDFGPTRGGASGTVGATF